MEKPKNCVTHSNACDCREYKFQQMQKENAELKQQLEKPFSEQVRAKDKWINELLKENEELKGAISRLQIDTKD